MDRLDNTLYERRRVFPPEERAAELDNRHIQLTPDRS